MINWSEAQILTAVVGLFGILSTGVITVYAFKRNRTGNGRYQ